MFHLHKKVPKKVAIAVSGGIDSMAALDFLRRNRDVIVLHYNHGTTYAPKAESLVRSYCAAHKLELAVGTCDADIPNGVSKEAWWREQRYSFFAAATERKIVMAHHLDDVAETWIFTALNGKPKLIPSERGNYIRPFLTTRKSAFTKWCNRKNVPFIEDPSNEDTKFMRNYIRHVLLPKALAVNPGLHKVLKKNILSEQN